MKVLFYSVKDFEQSYILNANSSGMIIRLTNNALSLQTSSMAKGYDCISIFTGDDASEPVIEQLHENGVKYIAIRAAGYDNVNISKANELGILVANVPEYSPYAIAEHAVGMMLALNRRLIVANEQVHQQNFTVGNLIGFDLHNKTIGIIGTGRIGSIVARIMHGFGCRILAYDLKKNEELIHEYGVEYTSLSRLSKESDIITLHTPLTADTRYLMNNDLMSQMKKGVMIVNTSRGGVVNTVELIKYLENGTIRYCGLDVYEKEKGIFFFDHSGKELEDPLLTRLMALPNVLITPHQAFATREALTNIASTTFDNISSWSKNLHSPNELVSHHAKMETML